MHAVKLHVTVDDAVVRALPGLSALQGQRVEIIALSPGEASRRRTLVPGALAGKIVLKESFDEPLPDDIRRSLEGDAD